MAREGKAGWWLYGGMLAAAAGVFLLIHQWGESLTAPAAALDRAAPKGLVESDTLFHVLLALTAVILVARLFGWLFGWLGQPPVIGEVLAGIALVAEDAAFLLSRLLDVLETPRRPQRLGHVPFLPSVCAPFRPAS